MWPKQKERINVVITNIGRHSGLMRNEVRREHIREEHEARARALEHFERTERAAVRQEYVSIRADISPVFYNETLSLKEGHLCEGTGKWLMRDPTFCKWLDPADTSTRNLWLQGIPGAGKWELSTSTRNIWCCSGDTNSNHNTGKTFLTTTVIHKSMGKGRALFAYLSHSHSSSTSALSILHSLLFQLLADDDDLQTSFCQSARTNLKNDTGVAAELLKALLNCAGNVYIIIDGVDEIPETERGRLLRQFLDLSTACLEAHILISSRPERDIADRLDPTFGKIRVDKCNSGSIQTFVTTRKSQWFQERGFFEDQKQDIEALLAPLASNARGWLAPCS